MLRRYRCPRDQPACACVRRRRGIDFSTRLHNKCIWCRRYATGKLELGRLEKEVMEQRSDAPNILAVFGSRQAKKQRRSISTEARDNGWSFSMPSLHSEGGGPVADISTAYRPPPSPPPLCCRREVIFQRRSEAYLVPVFFARVLPPAGRTVESRRPFSGTPPVRVGGNNNGKRLAEYGHWRKPAGACRVRFAASGIKCIQRQKLYRGLCVP